MSKASTHVYILNDGTINLDDDPFNTVGSRDIWWDIRCSHPDVVKVCLEMKTFPILNNGRTRKACTKITKGKGKLTGKTEKGVGVRQDKYSIKAYDKNDDVVCMVDPIIIICD